MFYTSYTICTTGKYRHIIQEFEFFSFLFTAVFFLDNLGISFLLQIKSRIGRKIMIVIQCSRYKVWPDFYETFWKFLSQNPTSISEPQENKKNLASICWFQRPDGNTNYLKERNCLRDKFSGFSRIFAKFAKLNPCEKSTGGQFAKLNPQN